MEDLHWLVPKHKSDLGAANAAVAAGFPRVQPILPQLLEWVQDGNWPVAHVLIPFLASIGKPLVPELRRILGTSDDVWKWWVLTNIVKDWPREVTAELRADLERIAKNPTPGEVAEEVAQEAREILEGLTRS